ncbi:MAG: glycosyltransferase [Bacillota bacterium]|jgi:glycosyltransferase involved in cell wall biosynthesis
MSLFHKPKVSVIIPSYNHEKFIGEAIESVLNQTYQDFELIIIDDCSHDNSIKVIEKFKSEKIRFFINEKNMGATYTANKCISEARGEYIALLNSDDIWELNKLEKQVPILDNNREIGAVFSNALFINEKGEPLSNDDYSWPNIFKQQNRSQARWLRRFFFELNCLCHPSILIRKSIYDRTNLYTYGLRQLVDFEMWVNILKFTQIKVLEDKLVRFRIFSNNMNTSAYTAINKTRNKNEIFLIMEDFFEDMPSDLFIEGFSDLFRKEGPHSTEELACEKAFMYFNVKNEISYLYTMIGIKKIHQLLKDEYTRKVLNESFGYMEKDFYNLTGDFELLDSKDFNIGKLVFKSTKLRLEGSPRIYNKIKRFYRKYF